MAYEVIMVYHLHMPSYFWGTFTEYPYFSEGDPKVSNGERVALFHCLSVFLCKHSVNHRYIKV